MENSDLHVYTMSHTVSEDGVLEEGRNAGGGSMTKVRTALKLERVCLTREAMIVLMAYAGLYSSFTNAHLTCHADVLRALALDEDYDWWANTPQESTPTSSSSPGALRLLLSSLITRNERDVKLQTDVSAVDDRMRGGLHHGANRGKRSYRT